SSTSFRRARRSCWSAAFQARRCRAPARRKPPEVMTGLLPRLWKPATSPPFRSLADEAARWSTDLMARWNTAGRPFKERLVDAALEALRSLPSSQGEQVLLHQDLHDANVLAAERQPWLAIDPKPLVV